MKAKIFFLPILAVAALILVSSCTSSSSGGATGGTPVFANGELADTLGFPLLSSHVATIAGVNDLQLTIMNDTKSPAHASITARTAENEKIEIILVKNSPTMTGIRIRAGTAGDEKLSRELLEKIKSHL
jgi:hypothetical protein